ncbi:MAG: DUF5916 domain-containing protein [Opitutales bacterium]
MKLFTYLKIFLTVFYSINLLSGDDGGSVVEVKLVTTPPVIDGKLEDECWKERRIIKSFRQRRPSEGEDASEKTEVRVCRNNQTLFFGVRCFDSQPDKIRAGVMQRDAPVRGDDYFFILIDPFSRGRDGYYFRTNANGAKGEALINSDMGKPNMDWDTIWEVRSQRDELGWTCEFAIPFRSIPFDPSSDKWRIDFGRWFSRGQERSKWVGFSRNRNWFSLEEAGEISGMSGAETGKGIDFKPYLSANWISENSQETTDFESGFDLFYRMTPSLTATFTYNTDFAETEVDQQRVNLSRFPLFYPEKRDFFLEGSDQFSFGGLDRSPLAFHSRTIGLSDEGSKIDVTAGAKLSGRLGPVGVGLLAMGLDDFQELESDEAIVGRFTYDLFDESKVGTIFTHGDPQSNLDNRLVGVDLNLRSSDWWNGQSISWHSFYMSSNDENKSSDDVMGTHFSLPNYPFGAGGHWVRTGENFEPALGFVRRRGGQSVGLSVSYSFVQTQSEWMDDISTGVEYDRYELLDGRTDSEELELKLIEVRTMAGDSIEFEIELEREILRESFEVVDTVVIPADEYRGIDFELEFSSSSNRPLFGELEIAYGDFYHGSSIRTELDLSWRPSKYFQLDSEAGMTLVDLPGEEFEVLTSSVGLRITPTTRFSFNSITQFDNQSKTIGINNRVRYILKPGCDLFLVLNKGLERRELKEHRRFRTFKNEAVAKLGWTFQF